MTDAGAWARRVRGLVPLEDIRQQSQEARRAAERCTLARGCKLAGIEPYRYLKDVLLRVASHPRHGSTS